jgi:hypothetical protein
VATVPAGCGEPPAPAVSASPAALRAHLVGTWVQCGGPSIFGPHSGGAFEMLANGTWHQLHLTPAGWRPLPGRYDSGLWRVLLPTAPTAAVTALSVRFVAVAASASRPHATAGATPENSPQWTVRVMLTAPPLVRGQFLEGTIVTNYTWLAPSTTAGTTPGS